MAKTKKLLRLARSELAARHGLPAPAPYDGDKRSTWTQFAKTSGFRLDRPSTTMRNAIETKQIIENLEPEDRRVAMAILRAAKRVGPAK